MTSLSSWLEPLPLIAVLRGITPAEIDSIGDALVGEGFRILEVPLNSPDPYVSITRLAQRYPECLVGAGTVLDVEDV
ncbi:MAG TPA: 2-dehydro-3-deoxy-6-phosphogalactonate aldolase, partial [Casimicrobiaceae bacterium]|nr:2-dehydro-3-deoxy-6-phosphogalactonate aldolase [Casimicrobiaceae bacterium]